MYFGTHSGIGETLALHGAEEKESRTWKEGSAPPESSHRFFIEVLLRWLLLIKCSISVVQHSFLYVFLWVIKPQRCLSW